MRQGPTRLARLTNRPDIGVLLARKMKRRRWDCEVDADRLRHGVGVDRQLRRLQLPGAVVNLDGSASSDPDSTPGTNDDIQKFQWFENYGTPTQTPLGSSPRLSVMLTLGQHVLTLEVTDSRGASSTAQATVTVVDTTPPAVACGSVGPVECTAPGGSAVTLLATATDACSPTVTVTNSRTAGGNNASTFYPLGTTSVTFTASDASGTR